MPITDAKAFNASLEKKELQIQGQVFTFLPRKVTSIPESAVYSLEHDHKDLGIFVVRIGDDLIEKEKTALQRFRNYLSERAKNYQARMDQDRRNGSTIKEPKKFLEAVKHIAELDERLGLMGVVEEAPSYLSDKDMGEELAPMVNIMAGLSEVSIESTLNAPKKSKGVAA